MAVIARTPRRPRKRPTAPHARSLTLESLESRQLLATASVTHVFRDDDYAISGTFKYNLAQSDYRDSIPNGQYSGTGHVYWQSPTIGLAAFEGTATGPGSDQVLFGGVWRNCSSYTIRDQGTMELSIDAAQKKMDVFGGELGKKAEAVLKQKLEASILGKRTGTVVVDVSQAHVVVGVSWKQGNVLDLEDEAATVAGIVKEEVPFVATLAVWATDAGEKKVFSAKIGHAPMQNINLAKIKDYAKTRYIKFFEEVKRGAEAQAADDKK